MNRAKLMNDRKTIFTLIEAILYGAEDLRLVPKPLNTDSLAETDVYVETEVTALSTGTDVANYAGRSTEVPGAPDYPRAVGYSNVGIIRKTGTKVSGLEKGQRVFSRKPHCSAYIASSADLFVKVPDNVSSQQASLTYLTQLGVSALRRVHYEAGERVAVIGLGVIGLATVGIARAMGASVSAIGNSPRRAQIATAVGARQTYESSEDVPPESADVVVLTANTWEAYRCAVSTARLGGRISVLGFPGRAQEPPSFNPLDMRWLYGKQLTIAGAGLTTSLECKPHEHSFNLRRNLEFVLSAMSAGSPNLEPLISHRLPFERMREAYELAASHSKQLVAAVFDWRHSAAEAN